MEPSESKSNTKEVVEGKPVKEIAERAVSLETKASVKSAVDHLETHGLEAAPVTDPEGTLVGKISKDRMIRGVSGRGHDPKRRHWNRKWKKRANLTATNMNRLPRPKK